MSISTNIDEVLGVEQWFLTPIAKVAPPPGQSGRYYLCLCRCGNTTYSFASWLKRGLKKSCGCWKSTVGALTLRNQHKREYKIWALMRNRCRNDKEEYANYHGRGITVHHAWDDFEVFLRDVGPAPSPKHSIDRIDNNGNYEPGNVRWSVAKEQMRNTSRNVMLTIDGVTKCSLDWAAEAGITRTTIMTRLKKGMSHKDAVFAPLTDKLSLKKAGTGGQILVDLVCPTCGSTFTKERRHTHLCGTRQKHTFCSRWCGSNRPKDLPLFQEPVAIRRGYLDEHSH